MKPAETHEPRKKRKNLRLSRNPPQQTSLAAELTRGEFRWELNTQGPGKLLLTLAKDLTLSHGSKLGNMAAWSRWGCQGSNLWLEDSVSPTPKESGVLYKVCKQARAQRVGAPWCGLGRQRRGIWGTVIPRACPGPLDTGLSWLWRHLPNHSFIQQVFIKLLAGYQALYQVPRIHSKKNA